MKDIFYLSWFYKDEKFHLEMNEYIKSGVPSLYLLNLLKQNKESILKGKSLCEQAGASVVLFCDHAYPDCFRTLERPPWILTYKGNLSLLERPNKLSIVGSRRADPEALYWLNKNIKNLKQETILVSGGAIGVDQEVHKVALREGLPTVLVMPVGITKVYPQSLNKLIEALFQKNSESVLLLSQFYPDQKVYKSSFYPRNYVLSAISPKLVVLQSEIRSGTMVTAKYALDQNKEIYTLPASPWDMRYSGNLKLIEEGAYQLMDFNFIHI